MLDVRPTRPSWGLRVSNTTTWGGAVLYDSHAQQWRMLASEMVDGCGMGSWERNSQIILASAANATASYRREQVLFGPWAHEPAIARAPTGEWVAWFSYRFPSAGRSEADPRCTNCTGGSTGIHSCPGQPWTSYDRDPTAMSWSASPLGPWTEPVRVSVAMPGIDTNLAAVIKSDGSVVGLWRERSKQPLPLGHHSTPHVLTATDWKDPSTYTWHPHPAFAPDNLRGAVEDPFVWTDVRGHLHALFHMQYGCTNCGGHAFSRDGLGWNWTGIAYTANTHFDDGSNVTFRNCERPHLVFDRDGVTPVALTNGVTVEESDRAFTLLRPLARTVAAVRR